MLVGEDRMADTQSVTTEQYRALQRDPIVVPKPEQLFEFIVETLAAKGLAEYRDADPFRAALPSGLFLLIPPRPRRPLAEVAALVEFEGYRARTELADADLTDTVAVPEGPYLVIDVEDGQRLCGLPEAVEAGRSPLTLWEGLVHAAVFPMVFESHDLVLCGTVDRAGAIPTLCRNRARPELRAYWYNPDGYPQRGAPSCAMRVGAPARTPATLPAVVTSSC
jgi:hypothetical protein